MAAEDFVARRLPASTPSLAEWAPPAPRGTLLVLGAHGGYAVTPRRFTLLFGRGEEQDDVHVPIGVDDPYVSRFHGRLVCDGTEWWMRNTGRLPIRMPREAMLLSDHEMPVEPGYLPLLIGRPRGREHLLELRLLGNRVAGDTVSSPGRPTKWPTTYRLDDMERLVLTALAQRYLNNEPHPQPVAWKQVVDDLNRVAARRPNGRDWNQRAAANIVYRVRERLSSGTDPLPLPDSGDLGEPLGNTLNHLLIRALLESTTLLPTDLALLDPDRRHDAEPGREERTPGVREQGRRDGD